MPFFLFTFAWRPRKKCARVSHGMAQLVLKVAHLAISMEPTLLLEKVSSYIRSPTPIMAPDGI